MHNEALKLIQYLYMLVRQPLSRSIQGWVPYYQGSWPISMNIKCFGHFRQFQLRFFYSANHAGQHFIMNC